MKITDTHVYFWKDKIAQWPTWKFKDENNIEYLCGEQYMMAQKALIFKDNKSYIEIMSEVSPKIQQNIGRKISNFDQEIWDRIKYHIVFRGNFLRITQNKELSDFLKENKGKIFVEASPYDNIWGIGLGENDLSIFDQKKWKGQNLLGKIFTEISKIL